MRPASQRFFIHSFIYLRILIISYLATFLGTNSLSVLMCRKAVNQSINLVQRLSSKHISITITISRSTVCRPNLVRFNRFMLQFWGFNSPPEFVETNLFPWHWVSIRYIQNIQDSTIICINNIYVLPQSKYSEQASRQSTLIRLIQFRYVLE